VLAPVSKEAGGRIKGQFFYLSLLLSVNRFPKISVDPIELSLCCSFALKGLALSKNTGAWN
jgi:hypothetical protein